MLYNLPGLRYADNRTEIPVLTLRGETLSLIYLGEVTEWNDPSITSDNPGVIFPNATITLVARTDVAGLTRGKKLKCFFNFF
jgi:ABC-type phosphate transport system substrate-binding protein